MSYSSHEPPAPPPAADNDPPDMAPPGARPLLRQCVVAEMARTLELAGAAQTRDELLADVERHAAYLERCASEAERVLHGSLDSAARLWLLLRAPIDDRAAMPRSILQRVMVQAQLDAPRAIDGDALLRLVAGVVRAAQTPAEADTMLASLGRLLQPLFHFDIAAAAADQARLGHSEPLRTFVTAHAAPLGRAPLQRPRDPVVHDPVPAGDVVLDPDRVAFDLASWRDASAQPTVGHWDTNWRCPGGVRGAMSQIDRFGPRFTITEVLNPGACAGQTVIIRGSNFGPTGRVFFPPPDVHDPAFALGNGDPAALVGVTPKRWTDSEVEVVVPVWATAGELQLYAFTRHFDPCATIDVHRLGNSVFFAGGLANVYQVSIGGIAVDLTSPLPTNLTPGDAVALTWHSSGGPSTRIRIQLMDGTTELWSASGLPGGFGGVVLPVPDPQPKQPRSATLVFTATSTCGATEPRRVPVWLSVKPRLSIEYVEVTQGVQTDLAEVLAGRGMPTVANKDTAVRVHFRCERGGWFDNRLEKITGALLVDGRRLAPTNVRVMIPPDHGFASVRGTSDPDVTNDTLNFTIPAAWLTPGVHQLAVQIVCDDPSGRISIGQNSSWNWVGHAPIRVRALYMALYGSDAYMLDYARRALDFLPTPLTDIGIAPPRWFPHTHDLSTDEGWKDLLDDLEEAWDDADEASGVRWLGIVAPSERYLPASVNHNGVSHAPGIAALAIGDAPQSGAHELGHTLGLHHIHQPAAGDGQPAEPFDDADNNGMLRRAGFDVRASKAVPTPAGDLMSYMPRRAPGISTWMRIFLNT